MSAEHTPPSTYILRELQDVAVPESVSWLPQTIGWKILAVLALMGAAYMVFRFVVHWWRNRYRGEALAALNAISIHDAQATDRVFTILKMVLRYIEPSNANLFGASFIKRLEGYLVSSKHHHVMLPDAVAETWMRGLERGSTHLTESQKQKLIEYSKHWVKHHQAGEGKS
ncbi:DUF4381 domain-containing protein [Vibrio sp. ZSDE26]|uniref:DUF4381 domain-containing protein n=1 Tax=Vibrio amylolyticus TaxID=2847292 RepID=A0A9X2BGC7_9VIBR|nr:DUF4381 domain-containing protein [Vibrio amylolyticus]MCK6262761.1 DUF4381 domain-containing protein [Vibrio amylolyticus]